MTNRAEFERLLDVYGFRCERFGQDLSTHARAQVVSAFAALASAPVANGITPAGMKEICPACEHQFACFHSPYIDELRNLRASAPVAGEAQPSDAEVLKVYAETVAEYADGRGFEAGTVAFARSLLRRYAAPQASEADALRQAIKTCGTKVIKALSAIARANGPGTRKEDDPELIYRSPVMDEVVRIRQAYDELNAALSAQPGAQNDAN